MGNVGKIVLTNEHEQQQLRMDLIMRLKKHMYKVCFSLFNPKRFKKQYPATLFEEYEH